MTIFRTMARHLAGILVGWVVAFITAVGMDVTGEQIAQLEASVMLILVAVFAFGWTFVEKALKPVFAKFGEKQVDDTADTRNTMRSFIFLALLIPATLTMTACEWDAWQGDTQERGDSIIVVDTVYVPGGGELDGAEDVMEPVDEP